MVVELPAVPGEGRSGLEIPSVCEAEKVIDRSAIDELAGMNEEGILIRQAVREVPADRLWRVSPEDAIRKVWQGIFSENTPPPSRPAKFPVIVQLVRVGEQSEQQYTPPPS